jgi:hypothetical protein
MTAAVESRVEQALAEHAESDPALARGLAEGTPIIVRWVTCPGWAHVQLAWVVTGALSHPVVRYVAVTDASARVLTDRPAAFAAITAEGPPTMGQDHARDLALLFLETVRPMDCTVALLDSDASAEGARLEAVRALFGRDGAWSVERRWLALLRLARLAQYVPPSPLELRRTLAVTLDADLHDASGDHALRLLPARALDVDERARLTRDRDALAPKPRQTPFDLLAFDGYWPMENGRPVGPAPRALVPREVRDETSRPLPFGAEASTLDGMGPPLRAALDGERLPVLRWTGQRGTFTALVQVDDGAGVIQLRLDRAGGVRARWVWLA